jgi:hypothetical protein
MRTAFLFAAFALFATAACSGDTGQVSLGITTTVTAPVGSIAVAPPDRLLMPVTSVEVHSVAMTDTADDDKADKAEPDDDDGAWVGVLATPTTIDLLSPETTDAFLARADVPPGRITQIRLVLGGSLVYVHDGTTTVIACPSCTTSGLKIEPRGTLDVAPGGHLDVVLDVTATLDLSRDRLDPVIVVATGV